VKICYVLLVVVHDHGYTIIHFTIRLIQRIYMFILLLLFLSVQLSAAEADITADAYTAEVNRFFQFPLCNISLKTAQKYSTTIDELYDTLCREKWIEEKNLDPVRLATRLFDMDNGCLLKRTLLDLMSDTLEDIKLLIKEKPEANMTVQGAPLNMRQVTFMNAAGTPTNYMLPSYVEFYEWDDKFLLKCTRSLKNHAISRAAEVSQKPGQSFKVHLEEAELTQKYGFIFLKKSESDKDLCVMPLQMTGPFSPYRHPERQEFLTLSNLEKSLETEGVGDESLSSYKILPFDDTTLPCGKKTNYVRHLCVISGDLLSTLSLVKSEVMDVVYQSFSASQALMTMFEAACDREDYRTKLLVIALANRRPDLRFHMSRQKGDLYVVADKQESFSVLVLFKEKFDSLHSQMNQKLKSY